jgi:hypothetical protein
MGFDHAANLSQSAFSRKGRKQTSCPKMLRAVPSCKAYT